MEKPFSDIFNAIANDNIRSEQFLQFTLKFHSVHRWGKRSNNSHTNKMLLFLVGIAWDVNETVWIRCKMGDANTKICYRHVKHSKNFISISFTLLTISHIRSAETHAQRLFSVQYTVGILLITKRAGMYWNEMKLIDILCTSEDSFPIVFYSEKVFLLFDIFIRIWIKMESKYKWSDIILNRCKFCGVALSVNVLWAWDVSTCIDTMPICKSSITLELCGV